MWIAATGRTPTECYASFIEPIQSALNYIVVGRLVSTRKTRGVIAGEIQSVALNAGLQTPARSNLVARVNLRVALRFRISEVNETGARFRAETAEYAYLISDQSYEEILAFHWSPEASGTARTYPHLHIGRTISGNSQFLPDRFHKLHIPTNPLPISSIVRFAIEELGVSVRPEFDRTTVLAELADRDD